MTYPQQAEAPPAPEGYQPQPTYGPPAPVRKTPEDMISNTLILAMMMLSGIIILVAAIMADATNFLDPYVDGELIQNMGTVAVMLLHVATFLLVVFLTLAGILRDDIHHWVRAAIIVFAAFVLAFFLLTVYGQAVGISTIP